MLFLFFASKIKIEHGRARIFALPGKTGGKAGIVKKSSMADVARLAGVSTATVSHVINRSRFVSEEVTQQVEKAIRQLISILLDNAVKYTPDGGRISFALKKEGRSIRLSVSNDTTVPMEKEVLDRLFDRFYRTDQSRNSSTGGYGLGLSIARSIVSAHKGKIRAENSGGNNLTITASLPE